MLLLVISIVGPANMHSGLMRPQLTRSREEDRTGRRGGQEQEQSTGVQTVLPTTHLRLLLGKSCVARAQCALIWLPQGDQHKSKFNSLVT
eukprot:1097163-Pelagomonas_calceolata.AAC.4